MTRHTRTEPSTTSTDPSTFNDSLPVPKLLVFDLDYTLWPFWVDTHPSPPFRSIRNGAAVKDTSGSEYKFYTEVPSVLYSARKHGIKVGAASRSCAPDDARDLLRLLSIPVDEGTGGEAGAGSGAGVESKREPAENFFTDMQIFPGNKVTHMQKLRKNTGVEYEDMLFFDDESRNKNVERELGVRFVMVHRGVSRSVVDEGIRAWRKGRGYETGLEATVEKKRMENRKGVDVVLDS